MARAECMKGFGGVMEKVYGRRGGPSRGPEKNHRYSGWGKRGRIGEEAVDSRVL